MHGGVGCGGELPDLCGGGADEVGAPESASAEDRAGEPGDGIGGAIAAGKSGCTAQAPGRRERAGPGAAEGGQGIENGE